MKTTKILTILVLALGLMICWPKTARAAEPMSSAFTYQGHLYDNNDVANGLYDFQFKLYKYIAAPVNDYIQVGNDVNRPDVNVIDCYFTVELDFGSEVFNGNARWLEIGVRPGVESDPCEYTPLSPRQEVTAVPYALQTRGILVDDALNVGIGAINPGWRLTVEEGGLNVFAGSSGETVGFSTSRFYVANNNEDSLMEIRESPSDFIRFSNNGGPVMTIIEEKVGIGTQSPDAKLDISGDVKVSGSVAASEAVIMATNTGSGDGVQGESWGSSGRGVEGWALWSGSGANYGGYFRAEGSGGYGVYGYASNSGNYENYGGYFMASGDQGRGVYGFVMGNNGHAVQGMAFDSGDVANYGGYFTARGASGRGVYGEATKTGAVENYGGYFKADGTYGRGVYGHATGNGYGVQGESSGSSGRGVYGLATGSYGMGVYGHAPGTGVAANYGGYFMAAGDHGKGIYGINTSSVNYGYIGGEDYAVYGEHKNGVYGYLGSVFNGVYGYANSGRGVHGYSSSGRGVYGSSSSGIGVYGESNWYAGWFEGTIRVEGDIQYTGNLSYISDIRLKENITLLRGAIEKVSCLKGIYFNFKGESSDNREIGVIAQDVEKVLPELVSTNEQGYKSVDYTKLTPVLIEAVKELKAENELLKQRLDALERTLQQPQTVIAKGPIQ